MILPGLLPGLLSVLLAASVTLPPPNVDVDYQLGGAAEAPAHVGIVVRDRHVEPTGRYDVCYVNGFQTQPDQKRFWLKRMRLVLRDDGDPVVDEAWGEWLLDLRTATKRRDVATIVGRWISRCAADGFDAVELDNLDSFTRSHGLLERRHALATARLFTVAAHEAGIAVAQKNLAGYDGTLVGFDFAIAEECGRYDECGAYVDDFGPHVLVVEYRRRDFDKTCAEWGHVLSVVLRDRDLTPDGPHAWC